MSDASTFCAASLRRDPRHVSPKKLPFSMPCVGPAPASGVRVGLGLLFTYVYVVVVNKQDRKLCTTDVY
jgi:hypothetical protein